MKKINKFLATLTFAILLGFSLNQHAYAAAQRADFIDVSHHNAENGLPFTFYQSVKEQGIKGVVIKVSEGTGFQDPAASKNVDNAHKAGLVVSAYHIARYTSTSSAINEAKWFDQSLKKAGFNKNSDAYVVDDIEINPNHLSPSALTSDTNAFVKELQILGYSKVDIYSSSYFYNTSLIPNRLVLNKPWLARYSSRSPVFSNGSGAWQWSDNYTFKGLSGVHDVSEDFAGKYTSALVQKTVNPSTVLKYGDRGESVKLLQQTLNSKGFNVGAADGIFGMATKMGLENFQRAVKMTADGIYGPKTAGALEAYGSKKPIVQSSVTTLTVKVMNLYLHSGNNFNTKAIKILHAGEVYKVYGKKNGMYNIGGGWVTANSKYVIVKES